MPKSVHWISREVDRLGSCWSNVSTEKGGPGVNQEKTTMWEKIIVKYLDPNPPPPTTKDHKGRECLLREKNSLQSKWQRIKPLIATYMKYKMLALANPVSRESIRQTEQRAMKAYRSAKNKDFPFLSTYRILRDEPKWTLDIN